MITVYSLPTCGNCKMLKSLLTKKNISFLNIEDREVLTTKGIRAVPTLEFEDGTQMTYGEAYRWVQAQEDNN